MKNETNKGLCLSSGITGLVGGIVLLIAPIVLLSTFAVDESGGSASGGIIFFSIIKIAVIALGVLCLIKYNGTTKVIKGGPILLIIGGGVGLIPLMGVIGGIIMIVGGAICLGSLGKFKVATIEEQ